MKVVIVGGGFAGVKTALMLASKPGFEVVLISVGQDFEYHGALYRTATGRSPLEVVIPIPEILAGASNIEFVSDKVIALNPKVKAVKGESGRIYQYDELVLSLGNEKNYFGIPGFAEYSHSMYTIADTTKLRCELVKLFSVSHRTIVRVVVVGAGASGVELAGSLKEFSDLVAIRYGHRPKQVQVDLVEGSDRVLPLLSLKASTKAYKRLISLGVNVMLQKVVTKCAQNIISMADGDRAADIIVWTAGSKTVDFYAKYPEIFELEHGKVKVDEYMRVPKAKDIYVLGDNAFTKYSGMAQTALHDAKFVASNLVKFNNNPEMPLNKYRVSTPAYVVPIGKKWAVLQDKQKVRSGYYGWLVRRRADLYIFKNFEPYKRAVKTWREANKLANF